MRAPPLSLRPITGAPTFIAMSMILQIFWAWRSDSEPPNTVKSWAKAKTSRPLIVPDAVTTPSPGIFCFSMPKSTQLCSTYMSYSSKLPGSSSTVSRSRAVSLPLACCAAIRFSPPPSRACSRRFSSSSIVVAMAAPLSVAARSLASGAGLHQRQRAADDYQHGPGQALAPHRGRARRQETAAPRRRGAISGQHDDVGDDAGRREDRELADEMGRLIVDELREHRAPEQDRLGIGELVEQALHERVRPDRHARRPVGRHRLAGMA